MPGKWALNTTAHLKGKQIWPTARRLVLFTGRVLHIQQLHI